EYVINDSPDLAMLRQYPIVFLRPAIRNRLMSARGPAIAIAVTFVLATNWLTLGSLRAQSNAENSTGSPKPPPLAGTNTVSGLHVGQKKAGVWTAEYDYFYTGDPPSAALTLELVPQGGSSLGPGG